MTIFELARLVMILRNDPSSAIAAALSGWAYPIDRTALAVLDLYDLNVMINSDPKKGRPKPHPARPYETANRAERKYGNTGGRSREEIVAILNGLGHQLPV